MSEVSSDDQADEAHPRNEAIAREYLAQSTIRRDPIMDLPLAKRVIPPRHLDLPESSGRACNARARIEWDTPYANIRNTVYCGLRAGHEGHHFASDDLEAGRRPLDGYVWEL